MFIDVGLPPEERHRAVTAETNPLTPRLRKWITHVAAAKNTWEYRFIVGDERICKVSKAIPAHALAHDPDAVLRSLGNLPYERLDQMIKTFSADPRVLIVVAEMPPIWLPREAAEWVTYGNAGAAERRKLGHEQQARVARTDVDADELDYFAEDGFVVVASGVALAQNAAASTRPRDNIRAALQKGVSDLTKTDTTMLDDPAAFLRRFAALDIVEYRGTATARLPEIARPASGAYHAQIELISGGAPLIATNETPVIEVSGWNWMRRTLRNLKWLLMLAALLIALGLVIALRRNRRSLDQDAAEATRNALFATSGAFFAIGIGIAVDAASSLARWVAMEAAVIGAIFLVLAFTSWIVRTERAAK